MKLSIIIVNYNVKYFLEQCLLSVNRAIQNIRAGVIVVDNASVDGSVEMVRQKFPWVQLMANNLNSGFSAANNQGIRSATGEYILLLNPDTVVAEDTFQKCIAFMDEHTDAGALGVRMVDGRGIFLPESKRGLPTPAVAFYKTFGLATLFPKSKIFGRYHLGFLPEDKINEVEVLSGAFMFIRKSVLDKIGLLDETFFMYGEDIDLSYRVIKSGYKNYYFPETAIIHYKGESTKKGSLNYIRVFYNAMLIFARKHYSGNQSGWFSLLINMAIFFRGFLTIVAGLFSSSYLFIVDALLSFAGIYFIKTYWEYMIKYSAHYYPNQFLFIVVPIYIFFWILATFLSGGYDKPYRVSKIIRGIFFGTIAIAAIYAFLPDEWRFSRAMILLGAGWTALEMLATRATYHLIKHQSLSLENEEGRRTLIVGEENECARAEKLLLATGTRDEVVAWIENGNAISRFSRLYDAGEIIFCSAHRNFSEIIDGIILNGPRLTYKILNAGSDALVGSDSKNTAGDLYSFDHRLDLAKPGPLRRKRMFDLFMSLVFIPLLPVNILVIPNRGRFLRNWIRVFLGKRTWVGYADDPLRLPQIPPGILNVTDGLDASDLDREIIYQLNRLYARHYEAKKDWRIMINNYSKLGR